LDLHGQIDFAGIGVGLVEKQSAKNASFDSLTSVHSQGNALARISVDPSDHFGCIHCRFPAHEN
jgi:hypothetical protein